MTTVEDELSPEQQAEVAAKREHQRCVLVWARLSDEQRAGTTFHYWHAHLPTTWTPPKPPKKPVTKQTRMRCVFVKADDAYCNRYAEWRPANIPMRADEWFCEEHATEIARAEEVYGIYRDGGWVRELPWQKEETS